MNKNILCLILAFALCLSLSACGSTQENTIEKTAESSSTPGEAESSEISEAEIFALADRLMQEGSTVFWWYHSDLTDRLGIDPEVDTVVINGQQLQKVGIFKTMNELKTATEAVFTKEFCETHLYDKINNYEKFKEVDGVLYHNDLTGGMGWPYSLPKEYIVQSVEEDRIVLTAICELLDGSDRKFDLILLDDGTDWKLDTYYAYTSEGFLGDLPPRDETISDIKEKYINHLMPTIIPVKTWNAPNDIALDDLLIVYQAHIIYHNPDSYNVEDENVYDKDNASFLIEASVLEDYVQNYFGVDKERMRTCTGYNAEKGVYTVASGLGSSLGITLIRYERHGTMLYLFYEVTNGDEVTPQHRVMKIQIDLEDDSVFRYLSNSISEELTFYDYEPAPGDDSYYMEVVENKNAILETVQKRIEEYRNGTPPDNPNHHPPYPSNFPPASELREIHGAEDFAIRFAGNPDALGGVYIAVPIGDGEEYELHMTVSQADIDGQVQWTSGNTFFERVSEIKWHKQDIDLYN